ncbi:MAG: hypothetical protein PHX61_04770 [Alphaproteobacteria bacterium]|nr:hypothetical protein [Alphaproteobacteria bacterium]
MAKNILMLRIFCVFLLGLSFYLAWVPALGSMTKSHAVVMSVHPYRSSVRAEFSLSDGQVLTCSGKAYGQNGSSLCPLEGLSALVQTQEQVTLWYHGSKIWQIETLDKRKIIDHQSVRHNRLFVLALAAFVFGGIFVFAPVLVTKP